MPCGSNAVLFSVYESQKNRKTVRMAEDEVNYSSVVFKSNQQQRSEGNLSVKKEETVYDEMKVQNKATEQTPDTNASAEFLSDKKSNRGCRHYQQLACCLGTLCIILVLGIIAVVVYHVTLIHENDETELNQLKENQTTLNAVNRNLTKLNNKLSSDNEDLKQNQTELTLQINNLTQVVTVFEKEVTNLTEENRNLKKKNEELETQNEELETEKKNLTEQIRNLTTSGNELNVSRAQWSINAYCPKDKNNNNRRCNVCQVGWLPFQSGCYAINDAGRPEQKTWEGARGDCIGKSSDLAVVNNETEKSYISGNNWWNSGNSAYWIGLRVEGGNWKWVDGRNLTYTSWITTSPTDGHCAVSVKNEFKSVSCDEKNGWICKKKALTL